MKNDDFRVQAHALVDWMADYLQTESQTVVPHTLPGQVRESLPASPPEEGEPFSAIFEDFKSTIVPNMSHWNHPGWFGYFPANNSPPSILAEMLTATLGAQCMSWQTSPAATELEQVVMSWLSEACALPDGFHGVIQDTASSATLVSLLTARERFESADWPKLRVYASGETHSSIDKAAKIAGVLPQNLVRLPVDRHLAIDADALGRAIEADLSLGLIPAFVCATIGTTSTTAIDPIFEIGELCQDHHVWLHVDAAYAGTAAIAPEFRWMFEGLEFADTYVFNPHKWMLTNFDCSAYFVKDVDALLGTFSTHPEYLRTRFDDDVPNFRDWGIPLGRRFRALKLWFVIRSYGLAGIRQFVRNHVALADELRARVVESQDFELMADTKLGLVCLRARPGWADSEDLDRLNESLLQRINSEGPFYATHTRVRGEFVIRVAIGQWRTKKTHVDAFWDALNRSLRHLWDLRST